MADLPLFTAEQLSTYLGGKPVTDARWLLVERVVAGWLREPTGLVTWPDPLPEQLFSAALDLAVIAHENPGRLYASLTIGGIVEQYSRDRAEGILNQVRAKFGGTGRPRGQFPEAGMWHDPHERYRVIE